MDKNLHDVSAYDQNRVDGGDAKVLSVHLLRYLEDGRFHPDESVRQSPEQTSNHYRTEKSVIHTSFNPHPDDVLTGGQLVEIGREYMRRLGYGNQPYLVFKHGDINRHHIHAISLRVDSEGRKISDKFEYRHNKETTELLKQKYDLHPAEGRKKGEEWQLKPVDVVKGDVKRQIACALKPLLELYGFHTVDELRTLLFPCNIGVEGVKGEIGGRTYHDTLYIALDGSGEATATPIESFRLGRTAGAQQLGRKMRKSAARIKSAPCRGQLRSLIAEALHRSVDERDFRSRLMKEQIDLVLCHNGTGKICSITFIDHRSRTVFNDLHLGKEFPANTLDRYFQERPQDLLPLLLPSVPSTVVSGNGGKVLGGLSSGMEPELNYVPRHPRPLEPDKKKRRQRYGRQG